MRAQKNSERTAMFIWTAFAVLFIALFSYIGARCVGLSNDYAPMVSLFVVALWNLVMARANTSVANHGYLIVARQPITVRLDNEQVVEAWDENTWFWLWNSKNLSHIPSGTYQASIEGARVTVGHILTFRAKRDINSLQTLLLGVGSNPNRWTKAVEQLLWDFDTKYSEALGQFTNPVRAEQQQKYWELVEENIGPQLTSLGLEIVSSHFER